MRPDEGFAGSLSASARVIEAELDRLLEAQRAAGAPSRLIDGMRHATLGGGKRLRGFLAIATAGVFGRVGPAPLGVACALECLHAYSLVHDDLPSMDDDDLRRGKPTVHRAFDEATAILVGDTLQTLAFEILALADTGQPDVRADLCLCLARASGAVGMAGGQMLDLAAEGRFDAAPVPLDAAAIRRLQAMKTGALLAASVEMGAILGHADHEERARCLVYGRALGACFQIADDILDVEADAAALGKTTGKDAAKGKGTLVALMGLDRAKAERDRLAAEAVAAIEPFGARADMLVAAARFTASRAV